MRAIEHPSRLLCGMTSPQGVLSPAPPKDFVRLFRGEARAMVAETLLPMPKIIHCSNQTFAPRATREWLENHLGLSPSNLKLHMMTIGCGGVLISIKQLMHTCGSH